jgi:hypothetical protein
MRLELDCALERSGAMEHKNSCPGKDVVCIEMDIRREVRGKHTSVGAAGATEFTGSLAPLACFVLSRPKIFFIVSARERESQTALAAHAPAAC